MQILNKQLLNSVKVILVLLVLLSLPLKNNINSISIITLTTFSIFYFYKFRNFNFDLFKKLSPFVFFFLLTSISYFYSSNKQEAVKIIIRLLPFVCFPIIFSIIKISKPEFLKIIKIFVYWMCFLALYSHYNVITKLFQNNDSLYDLFTIKYSYITLSIETIGLHGTYYAYFLLVCIVFLVYLFFQERKKNVKTIYIIIMLYMSFFIFHLSARIPIIALFLFFNYSIIYYFFKLKKIRKGILVLVLFYLTTIIVGYNVRVTRYRFQQIFGFRYGDGYGGGIRHDDGIEKFNLWNSSFHANNNIIVGNGVGDANDAIIKSHHNFGHKKFAARKYNAHNQFIQTYVGLGLIGFIALVLLFLYYFNLFYKNKHFIGYSFIFISIILFLTESILQRHHGIVFFSFIISFLGNQTSFIKAEF